MSFLGRFGTTENKKTFLSVPMSNNQGCIYVSKVHIKRHRIHINQKSEIYMFLEMAEICGLLGIFMPYRTRTEDLMIVNSYKARKFRHLVEKRPIFI